MKFLVITFGILCQLLVNSELLTFSYRGWIHLLVEVLQTSGLQQTISEHQQNFIMLIWMQFPLVIPFACLCAVGLSKTGNMRLFVYAFLGSFVFVFFVLNKLPILNLMLPSLGGLKYYLVFTNMFTFFFSFFVCSLVVKNITKRSTGQSRGAASRL